MFKKLKLPVFKPMNVFVHFFHSAIYYGKGGLFFKYTVLSAFRP